MKIKAFLIISLAAFAMYGCGSGEETVVTKPVETNPAPAPQPQGVPPIPENAKAGAAAAAPNQVPTTATK